MENTTRTDDERFTRQWCEALVGAGSNEALHDAYAAATAGARAWQAEALAEAFAGYGDGPVPAEDYERIAGEIQSRFDEMTAAAAAEYQAGVRAAMGESLSKGASCD